MISDPLLHAVNFIAITTLGLCFANLYLVIAKNPRRAKPAPQGSIYSASFEERAREAARIVQACLSRDRYEIDDEVVSIFRVQSTPAGHEVPGAHLWGKDDEILVLPGNIIDQIHRLLAPATDTLDYQPVEPIHPKNPEIEKSIELSVNPHDLSAQDLERIRKSYEITAPRLSQLAAMNRAVA